MPYDLLGKRVLVTGAQGMVGAALVRRLSSEPCEVLLAGRQQADMTEQAQVQALMDDMKPDAVIIASAKVGGILANETYPADFLYDNVMIASNLIHCAHNVDVNRLLFLGSSCIYPKFSEQPIQEGSLLTGPLEPTNEAYAIAKIMGIKLAEAYRTQFGRSYISAMPTNLYGPGDNFDLRTSHVLPALIKKVHLAKTLGKDTIEIWGTGSPMREFLHVDDCADALVFLLKNYDEKEHINVGSNSDLTILNLAKLVCDVIGFKGRIVTDTSKPDGTPRKLMSAEKLRNMNWQPSISLEEGIRSTYQWFLNTIR